VSTTTEEPLTGEVVLATPTPSAALEEYRPRIVMAPDEAKALADQLQQCMRAILKEDVDFGVIPGAGDKKNLLKPGAEKLLQWFGFGSRSIEVKIERDDPDHPSGVADRARRIGVTYRTEVTKTIPGVGDVLVATCEGYAGYDEDRYYVDAEDARRKAEAKERKWAANDKRQPKPEKWANVTEYRAPWNTLIKMAQKRSYVGAAIDATSAAGLFTQDMEDAAGNGAPAALVAEGRAAIEPIKASAKKELDAWFHTLHWPEPAQWDIRQWCIALVHAGRLDAAGEDQERRAAQARAATAERQRESGNGQPGASRPAAAKQEQPAAPAAEPPLPDGVDRIAQVFAERASHAKTAEDLAAIYTEAGEVNKMDARIREPGGTVVGTLRAYFTYCENTLQEPAGSPA
jgi:hypothetical protein